MDEVKRYYNSKPFIEDLLVDEKKFDEILMNQIEWNQSINQNEWAARHSANQTFFSFQLFRMSWMKKLKKNWRRMRHELDFDSFLWDEMEW